MASITLKALVDKKNNRVIFAESNADFVDILFSFFTIPMGKIIKLTHNQPPAASAGCMNNLYKSIMSLEVRRFQTETCRKMLLNPRNAAAAHCENLKLKLDDDKESLSYFHCSSDCASSNYKLLSQYRGAIGACGDRMDHRIPLVTKNDLDAENGVFVKGLARLIISDELEIVPSSTAASFSILSKLGIMDGSVIEERSFNIGLKKALKLLKCSLESKTPWSEVLLKNNPVPELSEKDFEQGSSKMPKLGATSNQNGKIVVKLMISKSKQMVCYAEAGEDFVNLLFSFLSVPLRFVVKQMQGDNSKGCINRLNDSVQGLDAKQYLKSPEKKAMLLSPKLASGFSYENQLLDIEEDTHPAYYFSVRSRCGPMLVSDKTLLPSDSSQTVSVVTVMDPTSHGSHHKDRKSGQGFLRGPALFTITDDLIITAISSISSLSVLSKLKVPFGDIEERTVHVVKNEALPLLVASLISKSALTNAFLLKEPKPEFGGLRASQV